MKKIIIILSIFSIVFSFDQQIGQLNGFDVSMNKIVLKISSEFAPKLGVDLPLEIESLPGLKAYTGEFRNYNFYPLFQNYQNFSEAHYSHDLHQYYVLETETPQNIKNAIDDLIKIGGIIKVEPDYIKHANITPNDTYYSDQWAHNNTGQAGSGNVGIPDCDTDTDEAWDITTGSEDIIIAILDTGVNPNHSEFAGKMVDGWDFVNNDDDPDDDYGHGTPCAGIAAAIGNNNSGIAGVSWGSKIMSVKILDSGGSGNDTDIANGVLFAVDNGARIVSMSLGGGSFVTYFDDAITYANENGTVVFAASGNDNTGTVSYPSRYDDCISVGALSPCNERKNPGSCDGENWWGSNFGAELNFMAPGVLINTTAMGGGYTSSFNGTSSACPHAAGIGALILSVTPALSADQVLAIMELTADDLYGPGFDTETGFGRLNAFQSVSYSMSAPQIDMPEELIEFEMDPGDEVSDVVLIVNTGDDDLTYSIDPEEYYWTDSDGEFIEYEWIDIEGIGTEVSFVHNDEAAPESIQLDFAFPFYGLEYTECIVNANGWIGFGDDNVEWLNTVLPSDEAPMPGVFGFWDDLNPNNSGNSDLMAGDVYYHSDDSRLVVWFDNVVHWYGSNEIEGTYDFQMVLYNDGVIMFNYRSMVSELGLATIGIQNEVGDDGILINYNMEYAHDEMSILIQTMHDFLTIDPLQATIPPMEAQEMTITVNSAGVAPGLYQDWIKLTTNDFSNIHPVIPIISAIGTLNCGEWNPGDVNQDDLLNILDIITIVNIIIGSTENPDPCQVWASDANGDGDLNVLDLISLVSIILEQ